MLGSKKTMTPEEVHIDTNFQRRLDNAVQEVYAHYPDNKKRHEILQKFHDIKKLSIECLEHKE